MTETIKVNLDKTWLFLRIMGVIAGVLIGFFTAYNQLDQRMDNLETAKAIEQLKFTFIEKEVGEVGDKVDKIYDYIIKSTKSDHLANRER